MPVPIDTVQAMPPAHREQSPPTPRRPRSTRFSEAAAEAWIPRTCFKNGPPSRLGVELELLVVDAHRRDGLSAHFPNQRFSRLLDGLAHGGLDGLLTVEPGGQVELSSRPGHTLADTVDVVQRDLSALRSAPHAGAQLIGLVVDPFRPPRRTDRQPRYAAMERYLDAWGPSGRVMMCSTASVQVNVEAGVDGPVDGADESRPKPVTGSRTGGICCTRSVPPWSPPLPIRRGGRAGQPAGRATGRRSGWSWIPPARVFQPARPGECLGSLRPLGAGRAADDGPPRSTVLGGTGRGELPRLAAPAGGRRPGSAAAHPR